MKHAVLQDRAVYFISYVNRKRSETGGVLQGTAQGSAPNMSFIVSPIIYFSPGEFKKLAKSGMESLLLTHKRGLHNSWLDRLL